MRAIGRFSKGTLRWRACALSSGTVLGAGPVASQAAPVSTVAEVIDAALAGNVDLIEVPEVAAVVSVDSEGIVTGSIAGTSFAEVEDMLRFARSRGQSGGELVALDAVHRAQVEVVSMAQAHREAFAGYWLSQKSAWIGFTRDPPKGVLEAARSVDGMSVQGGMAYSFASLESMQRIVTDALTHETKADLAAWIDARSATIVIRTPVDPAIVKQIADDALSADVRSPTIGAMFVADAAAASDDNMRGGGYLNGINGGADCTAGFSIIATGGSKRMGTAGHCVRKMPSGGNYVLHWVDGSDSGFLLNLTCSVFSPAWLMNSSGLTVMTQ